MATGTHYLRIWESLVQKSKESRKLSFVATTLFGTQQDPLIYQWLFKLKNSVYSKYTFYFEEILAAQMPESDFKAKKDKLPIDFGTK